MTQPSTAPSTALYVARQPIFDVQGKVFGYELLYRATADETECSAESDLASARVLTTAVLDLGLDMLTAGRPAFLNVTRSLILDRIDALVPPRGVVLELLETIDVSPEVVEACRRLQARGYLLALDDFVPGSSAEALLPHAAFVKVDMLATPEESAAALAARLRPTGVTMVAEKIENRESLQHARDAGYSLFQGYFFCRPTIRAGSTIPAQQMVYLRLLAALSRPDLGAIELEDLVKQDVSLSLRVLRFVNSAAVPVRTEVHTIRQALFHIGMDPIRKWASIWCLTGLNAGNTPELSTLSLVRARACEIVGERVRGLDAPELFLVGLCSLLDVMLHRPMSEALDALPLSADTTEALLGGANRLRHVLDSVIAYEAASWKDAADAARRADIDPSILPSAYTRALAWADEVARAGLTPVP
jgi:EAL and modified HD-GYP domain-containing signal transduction protein